VCSSDLSKALAFSKMTRGEVKRFGRYGHSMVECEIGGDWFGGWLSR
jgi:hypothetical protein